MNLIKSGTISRSELHHKKKYKERTPRPVQKDFDKMYYDIEKRGQIRPIAVDEEFNIIDGYTRDEILGKQRIDEIKYDQYEFEDDDEKFDFIDSMNVKRRHLTDWQKFEAALPIYEQEKIEAEKREKAGTLASEDSRGKATTKAAKEAGMSTKTFERALEIKKKATPEQIKKVETGETKIKTLHTQLTRRDRNLPKVPLPKEISDVFVADVPYAFDDKGGRGAAEEHYPTMKIEEIREDFKNLAAAENAIMFFWMSPSIQYDEIPVEFHLQEKGPVTIGIPVYKYILDAAGFKVKGEFVWDKEHIGAGNWNRYQHENLLIAIKGNMPIPAELFSSIIKEKRSAHSKKPNLWPIVKKMYPERKYSELYSRTNTPGVLCHGNELEEKS